MPPYTLTSLNQSQLDRRADLRGFFCGESADVIRGFRDQHTDPFEIWVADEMIAECEARGFASFSSFGG